MSMGRSNRAPVGQTWAIIDKVNQFIEGIDYLNDSYFKRKIDYTLNYMEEIRDANAKLKEWGEEMADRAEEFENESDYNKSEVERLENEVSVLEEENKTLRQDIVNLENEIYNLKCL